MGVRLLHKRPRCLLCQDNKGRRKVSCSRDKPHRRLSNKLRWVIFEIRPKVALVLLPVLVLPNLLDSLNLLHLRTRIMALMGRRRLHSYNPLKPKA